VGRIRFGLHWACSREFHGCAAEQTAWKKIGTLSSGLDRAFEDGYGLIRKQ
jgi:hypothetical protein